MRYKINRTFCKITGRNRACFINRDYPNRWIYYFIPDSHFSSRRAIVKYLRESGVDFKEIEEALTPTEHDINTK